MTKDLKPKSASNKQPDSDKVNKQLKPKDDLSNHKDLNQNKSDYDPNESIKDSTNDLQNNYSDDLLDEPNLDQKVIGNEGSYMDGFDDDASGWMADKLEGGLGSAKDNIVDKFLSFFVCLHEIILYFCSVF